MVKHRRRNRIPNETRERIDRAFEDPSEDYLAVADTVGVTRSTARSIVAKYNRTCTKDESTKDCVVVEITLLVDEDCLNETVNKTAS